MKVTEVVILTTIPLVLTLHFLVNQLNKTNIHVVLLVVQVYLAQTKHALNSMCSIQLRDLWM